MKKQASFKTFSEAIASGRWRPSKSSQFAAEGGWFWDVENPKWETHFDEAVFCRRLPPGELLLIGDSITSQSFMSLWTPPPPPSLLILMLL